MLVPHLTFPRLVSHQEDMEEIDGLTYEDEVAYEVRSAAPPPKDNWWLP